MRFEHINGICKLESQTTNFEKNPFKFQTKNIENTNEDRNKLKLDHKLGKRSRYAFLQP